MAIAVVFVLWYQCYDRYNITVKTVLCATVLPPPHPDTPYSNYKGLIGSHEDEVNTSPRFPAADVHMPMGSHYVSTTEER